MNFLFDFLKHIRRPEREILNRVSYRGTTGKVWILINEQAIKGTFSKADILKHTGITASHFDKITSELLSKSYKLLFNDDTNALLLFLSKNMANARLFYNEINQLLKKLPLQAEKSHHAAFYKNCYALIHGNLPVMHRDPKVSVKIGKQYVDLFKGAEKKQAGFYIAYQLLYEKMEVAFAAAAISKSEVRFKRAFNLLGEPGAAYDEDTLFTYYLTHIYFYHALERFEEALATTNWAIEALGNFTSPKNDLYLLRINLKKNEFLYFLSHFDKAYENYSHLITSPLINLLPDRAYHHTKYLQICMITNHMDEAAKLVTEKLTALGSALEETIITRDAITFAKYYLFRGNYPEAFRFIQLGFIKNPKGRYLQYEIELRHLQVAYFVYTGQSDVAIDMCKKNMKYLRNHGYNASTSDFSHFYILIKAILKRNTSGKFSKKEADMLHHQNLGSYGVYGRLLLKMMK